jgi:anhydro-N-acetylmuramic acid kinase
MSSPLSKNANGQLYIGLMSGTSLDGVDGVLARLGDDLAAPAASLAHLHIPFGPALRDALMALQTPGPNEIHREAQVALELVAHYADCVLGLLQQSGTPATDVVAIGVHGQTIRHRPEAGYTRQTNNPALLAERCGIDVVADFRSRDIAAGGQGAPLVPAFHRAIFGSSGNCQVVANIGGIANISVLRPGDESALGYDTGPGNVLMDLWIRRHLQQAYDANGAWAATGQVLPDLLARMSGEAYFAKPAPKSTGRDLFHQAWLDGHLAEVNTYAPQDVQRTLCEVTATSLAREIRRSAPDATSVFICGGGALNGFLIERIGAALAATGVRAEVNTTQALGVDPMQVEALAFAWLARQFIERRPGNLAAVTGARGPRVLGALYPA